MGPIEIRDHIFHLSFAVVASFTVCTNSNWWRHLLYVLTANANKGVLDILPGFPETAPVYPEQYVSLVQSWFTQFSALSVLVFNSFLDNFFRKPKSSSFSLTAMIIKAEKKGKKGEGVKKIKVSHFSKGEKK